MNDFRKKHPVLSAMAGGSVGGLAGAALSGPHGAETFLGTTLGSVVGGMLAAPKGRRAMGAGIGWLAGTFVGLSWASKSIQIPGTQYTAYRW